MACATVYHTTRCVLCAVCAQRLVLGLSRSRDMHAAFLLSVLLVLHVQMVIRCTRHRYTHAEL